MIGWALLGIIALYLLICVGIGMLRGLARSRIRTITVLVSAIVAFILTLIAKSSLGSIQDIEGVLRSSNVLSQDIMNTLSSFLGMSPTMGDALIGIVSALIMPLFFLGSFIILCVFTWIIYMIVWIVLRKRLRASNEKAKMRLLRTVLLSIAHGLIVVFIFLVPINVYTQMVTPIINAVDEAGLLEDSPEVNTIVNDYVAPLSENGVMATFRFLAGQPVSNAITNFKVGDTSVNLSKEIGGISKFAGSIMSLGKVDMTEFSESQADVFNTIADCIEESNLLSTIIGEVIYCSTDAWIRGENFVGVERPSVGEMVDPTFETLLKVLHRDSQNLSVLKNDINTVADMISVMARYDLFSKIEDTDLLIQQLGADGMVKDLITVLGSNSSMKVLIGEIRNMGMRAIAQSLDIPANGEVVYEQFLNDIAVALNETKGMDENERIETLTNKVKEAFNEANVPIEEDILDCYSASLIYDLGGLENITSDDISDFFTAYAMQTGADESNPLAPVAHNENAIFKGNVYGSMTEDQLANSGAAVLATVTVQLSKVEGDEQAILEVSAVILQESYATLYNADSPVFEKIMQIEITAAIDKSAIENTAGMKEADTMNSGVVTLDMLLANVDEIAENINSETLVQEAESLNAVFADMSKLIDPDASMDSVEDVIGTLGPVLNSLQSSVSVGGEATANLLVATLQSKTVREKANLDMNSATSIAKKATESTDGEEVDYEKTMNSFAGVVILGSSISSGEITSEEDVRKLIENLTPQSAAVLREFVTEERMKEFGMPEENSKLSSELLLNLFDYLAGDLSEDQFDHEAKALQQLVNIAIAATDNASGANKIFGVDGALGKTAYEMIDIVIKSDAICHSLEATLATENGLQRDPFGVGKSISEDSADKQEFDVAAEAYRSMNPSEETDRRLDLIAALFGIEITA